MWGPEARTGPEAGAEDGQRPLEGKLVQVHSLASPLQPNTETAKTDPGAAPFDANGHCGRCLLWDEEDRKYVVHTFEGAVVGVPEENLRELGDEDPEDGGFDVAWPERAPLSYGEFAGAVGQCIAMKGHCVVQMFTTRKIRECALEEARDKPAFDKLRAEMEVGYLGTDSATKCGVLELDSPEREIEDALSYCDRDLTNVGLLVAPVVSEVCGYDVYGRSGALVRTAVPAGREPTAPEPLQDSDIQERRVEEFVAFLLRRKLCMLYLIDNEGGTLELFPKAHLKMDSVKLPLKRCRIVMFRHDMMDYSYQPHGSSVALQTWLLDEPQVIQFRQLPVPPGPQGCERIHVTAATERFSGNCAGCDMTMNMFCAGSDTLVDVPHQRWDKDLYCMNDRDAPLYGKAYIMHGAFCSFELLVGFDNKFFGYTEEAASAISPSQRWVMEVGYETLHHAGWTKLDLMGQRIGTFIGDSGDEWTAVRDSLDQHLSTCKLGSVTPCRLAHVLGMTGPSISSDTACSASLVATSIASHWMRRTIHNGSDMNPLAYESDKAHIDAAVCMGILCLFHPGGWIGECGATMLSYKGRCFTFDMDADGFIRGEGCCSMYIKSKDDMQAGVSDRSLATLMGSCVNQDGRSASLTAPHGPSQQECFKACLREAQLQPDDVVVSECHGTGTALGDPIEVGAVRGVMMSHHSLPLLHTAAKSHCGHNEANAGACGLLKIIIMLNAGISTPCPHMRVLNPHLNVAGYPVYFTSELTTTSRGQQCMGVSSFGFGGTNARAELWSEAERGQLKDGTRTLLDRDEAARWIDKMLDNLGTDREDDMVLGPKSGH